MRDVRVTPANRLVRDGAWLATSVAVALNYVWNLYRLVGSEVRDGTDAVELAMTAVLVGTAGIATFWLSAGAWRRTSWHARYVEAHESPDYRHDRTES